MASELTVQTLKGPTSGPNANKILIADGHSIDGVGGVLQVKYFSDDTTSSLTGNTSYVTVLTASFTPKYATSKVLILAKTSVSCANGPYDWSFRIRRDGTNIGGNTDPDNLTAAANTLASASYTGGEAAETRNGQFLDSPATTSAISYTLQVVGGENATYYVNRAYSTNASYYWSAAGDTSFTFMEIAG